MLDPPPINRTTKPDNLPQRIGGNTAEPSSLLSSLHLSEATSSSARAGVIYPPGSYPTPELVNYPLGCHLVLRNGPFTSQTIQQALDNLGPNTTLYLPQRSRWTLHSAL